MRHIPTLRSLLAAAVLSPLAATCTPVQMIEAEAHEAARLDAEQRLVRFVIDGAPAPRTG